MEQCCAESVADKNIHIQKINKLSLKHIVKVPQKCTHICFAIFKIID